MDPLIITLIIVLILLTLNTVAITVAVVLILLQVRESVRKANTLIDSVKEVTDTVITPLTKTAGILSGIVGSASAFKSMKSIKDIFTKKEY